MTTELWSAEGQPVGGKWMSRVSKVRVTEDLIYFDSEGLLSNEGQQVPLRDVYDVDTSQGVWQKSKGLGTMKVHVRRENGDEETVTLLDMPNFREGARIINEASKAARLRERQSAQTHYYAGGAPTVAAPGYPAPPVAQPEDDMAVLSRLRTMRDEGLLTEEEYAAKKAEVIARI